MSTPPVVNLQKKVDAKYTLVIITAKRARQLIEKSLKEENTEHFNPVSTALWDIANDKVLWDVARKPAK